jgi:hypothetical protein
LKRCAPNHPTNGGRFLFARGLFRFLICHLGSFRKNVCEQGYFGLSWVKSSLILCDPSCFDAQKTYSREVAP